MSRGRVHLHIERLVLGGVAGEGRDALAGALQRQLAQLLAEPRVLGELASLGHIARLSLPALHVPANTSPGRLGSLAARAIVGGFGR